jgi:hypothetical protein
MRSSRVARQHQNPMSPIIGVQRTAPPHPTRVCCLAVGRVTPMRADAPTSWWSVTRDVSTAKVTTALPLQGNTGIQMVSIVNMNMEPTNSMLVRVSRFFNDRYAYRTQPGYTSELVAFGMIVFIAVWPIILVAHAIAVAPR